MFKNKIIYLLVTFVLGIFLITSCTVQNATRKYVVEFDSNGGSYIGYIEVESGKYAIRPSDPYREGYILEGWYLDDVEFDFKGTPIYEDITLQAKWKVKDDTENPIIGEDVDIKSLSAVIIDTESETETKDVKKRNNNLVNFDTNDKENGNNTVEINEQYIVMYKTEKDIEFTIELKNPKSASIDAVEIYCDDPTAQILMDDRYENIQYSDNNSIMMNWGQENPYKKTYRIRTTSDLDVVTLKVVDIKINGKWKVKNFKNDTLEIYKIEESDLTWNFVTNVPEFYKWSFSKNDNKISNLIVKMDDEIIEPDTNGIYTVYSNGTLVYEYDLLVNNKVVKWTEDKEIELFWIEYPEDDTYFAYDMRIASSTSFSYNYAFQVGAFDLHGTDIVDTDGHQFSIVIDDKLTLDNIDIIVLNNAFIGEKYKNIEVFLDNQKYFDITSETKIDKAELYVNGYRAIKFYTQLEWHKTWAVGNFVFNVKYVDYDGRILKDDYVYRYEDSTPTSVETYAREGYVFSGWSEKATSVSSNMTIYAQYKKINTTTSDLEFELSEDKTYYILIGKGSSSDTSIIIPSEYNGLPVKEIKNIFASNLYNIIIPEGIEKIHDGTFLTANCIEEVFLPASLKEIGYSFSGGPDCSLKKFIVHEDNPYFTSIDGVLYTKDLKTLVLYPMGKIDGKVVISENVETISSKVFTYCIHLKEIEIPRSLKKIEDGAFMGCRMNNIYYHGTVDEWLKINMEMSWLGSALTMNDNHFFINENDEWVEVKNIVISNESSIVSSNFSYFDINSVTILEGVNTIDKGAFRYCYQLNQIFIPKSIKKIDENAFDCYTKGMAISVYYYGTLEEWNEIEFSNYYSNPLSHKGTLYVLDSTGKWVEA